MRRSARLRRRRVRRSGCGLGGRRDRRCEEGCALRRRAAPVHRHRRADRERPGRGVLDLRRLARPRAAGPGAVPAEILDHRSRPVRRRRGARGHLVRDQTGAGDRADPPGGRSAGGGLGQRRRGLRRRPEAAPHDPRARAGLRAAGLGEPAGPHRGRPDPGRPAARPAAHPGLATTVRRRRQQGSAALLLGLGRPAARRRDRHRPPSPAHPPQRQHRRAGLPALLQPPPGAAAHPGSSRRAALANRGVVPGGQRG